MKPAAARRAAPAVFPPAARRVHAFAVRANRAVGPAKPLEMRPASRLFERRGYARQ
jgi:hypothetical protein